MSSLLNYPYSFIVSADENDLINNFEEQELFKQFKAFVDAVKANRDDFDSEEVLNKRAFKLLRVGRSIGNMAHRLPRMG